MTAPDGGGLAYTYDGFLKTRERWSGAVAGLVSWAYDNDFRVASTSVNGSAVSYKYDPDSLLTAAGALSIAREPATGRVSGTTLGAVATSQGYDEYGDLASFGATAGGSTAYSYSLTRDLAGRITGKTETVQGATDSYAYGYDDAGRLATVTRNGQQTASYVYDPNGNRLQKTTQAGGEVGSYDDQDRMYAYGPARYAYRPSGELAGKTVAGQTTSYDHDAFGNLRGVALPDGRQVEYLTDGRNRRIGKRVNGTLVEGFLYDGQFRPVAWLDGTGAVKARFVYGTRINVPEYMVTAAGTYHIVTDHLGSPRLVVNTTTGAIAQRIDYDEWGVVLADTAPAFQPFGFAGGLYDRDTGLVRFGARDYDPQTGRWTNKDRSRFGGGDTNLYVYVANDPVNWRDPSGLYTEVIIWSPAGYGKSSFGHVSVDINGTSYSLAPGGIDIRPIDEYMQRNGFRDSRGIILGLSPEQEAWLASWLASQGNYNHVTNNCGNPIQTGLDQLGFTMPWSLFPTSLGEELDQLPIAIGETYHPKTQ